MDDTAILIVTYNSAAEIGACLEAAIRTGAEIIVIDNASQDDTVAIVRQYPVRLHSNRNNLGFAGAVNQGVRATQAALLLLLNPDAVLTTPITPLIEACNLPGIGAASGLLADRNGNLQVGFMVRRLPTLAALGLEVLGVNRLFPRNPVNWRFRCLDLPLSSTAPVIVEQPAGALFLFRREIWDALGGFDERFYPLWFEDVDFCARLQSLGQRILLVPEVVAKHTGAHSILNMALEFRQIYWYGNLLRYAAKHFSPVGLRFICICVMGGAFVRSLAGFPGGNRVWMGVAKLALSCLAGTPGWDRWLNGGAESRATG